MQLDKYRVKRDSHFPWSAATLLLKQLKRFLLFLCCQCVLLAYVHLAACWEPQVNFQRSSATPCSGCVIVGGLLSQILAFTIGPCWISYDFCCTLPLACAGHSGWQPFPWAYCPSLHRLASPTNVMKLYSVVSDHWQMLMLNRTGPSTDLCNILVIFGYTVIQPFFYLCS